VIGASAGALDALSRILPAHPVDFHIPMMIVVHLPPDKRSVLADLFQGKCPMNVVEAEDKEPIDRRTIYFAPPDYHMLVEVDKTLSLFSDEPVLLRDARSCYPIVSRRSCDVARRNCRIFE
jgi:two-component system chemotaxis response regulator CheB